MKKGQLLIKSVCLSIMLIISGCSGGAIFSSPAKTAKDYIRYLEKGQLDAAVGLHSERLKARVGIPEGRTELTRNVDAIKSNGGVKSVKIKNENITGEMAEVTCDIIYNNEGIETAYYRLIKEKDGWKLDGSNTEITKQPKQ